MILLWDFLASVLVLFPLLTGGIWIKRPGLFLELSELAIPMLVVTLVGLLLKYAFKYPLEKSFVLRGSARVWRLWCESLEEHRVRTLLLGWIFFGTLLVSSALRRHHAFESFAWDLGIYHNAIWNLAHGNGYISASKEGMNEFIDHQSFAFALLVPLIRLFPKAETLLIVQGIWLSFAGVLAYNLGLQYLPRKHWATSAFPLLIWTYVPVRNANFFDFHPETMMLALFLGGIVGAQSPRIRYRVLGCLALFLAFFSRESAGPIAMGIGIAWLLGASPRRSRTFCQALAVALMILGPLMFYFDITYVPKIAGGPYPYHDLYKQFGQGIPSILLAPIQKPKIFFETIFAKSRFKFLFWMFAPLGFIPFLNPKTLVAALPPMAILFLTYGDLRVTTQFHYSIEEAIGIFWAFPRGVLYFEHAFANRRRNRSMGREVDPQNHSNLLPQVWVLFFALAFMGRSEIFRPRYYSPSKHHQWLSNQFLPAINPDVTLSVTDTLVPHLTQRYWARNLVSQVISTYSLTYPTARQNPLQGQLVQCVIEDASLINWPMDMKMTDDFHRNLPTQGYSEVYACGKVHVWSQAKNSAACLINVVPCVE